MLPLHDATHGLQGKHVLTVDLFNRDMVTKKMKLLQLPITMHDTTCTIFGNILYEFNF